MASCPGIAVFGSNKIYEKASKQYMKFAKLIAITTLSCAAVFLLPANGHAQIGNDQLKKFWQDRDKAFKDIKKSPLAADEIANFKGLLYFPVNPDYRVAARFIRTPYEKKFEMATSTGATRIYVKYGDLIFELRGNKYRLGAYRSEELSKMEEYKNYLLIPFTDLTSGKETYGGGRYINFEVPASEQVTLDFNFAYNPSCAYNPKATCPIPPRENHLMVKIEAGEKAYRKP
jgi:uncharacterized protein (DUF1684 family)